MKIDNKLYNLNAVPLAKILLGKTLVRVIDGKTIKCRIVETEAYNGPLDKANHAFGNLRTPRTEPMFLEGGYVYVFLIYGMYSCFNVVCGSKDSPHAVLIRAVEPLNEIEYIKTIRKIKSNKIADLTNGPGKLCKALSINRNHNLLDLKNSDEIYLEENQNSDFSIEESKRVNIDYAEEYTEKFWRFYIKENPFVSVK